MQNILLFWQLCQYTSLAYFHIKLCTSFVNISQRCYMHIKKKYKNTNQEYQKTCNILYQQEKLWSWKEPLTRVRDSQRHAMPSYSCEFFPHINHIRVKWTRHHLRPLSKAKFGNKKIWGRFWKTLKNNESGTYILSYQDTYVQHLEGFL